MNVQIVVRVDGRDVAEILESVETLDALDLEEHVERIKRRAGRAMLEIGLTQLGESVGRPRCCGRPMESHGRRVITVTSRSGEVPIERTRYRCSTCHAWRTPADAAICCGTHRLTRLLGKSICQLATIEHFTRLEQLMADQHGVHLGHDPMMELVHDVGAVIEERRLAAVAYQCEHPEHRSPAIHQPKRLWISCDGVMYGTNETEPDPLHPEEKRQVWCQMRVGVVAWQDDHDKWHKQMIWGQEADYFSFGASLYELACRCGYHDAQEKLFAADGADWCWAIRDKYFADTETIVDWYHASEHVWNCARELHADPARATAFAKACLSHLYERGGKSLLAELLTLRKTPDAPLPSPVQSLVNYIQPRQSRMNYPRFIAQGWPIGTGMMESTGKQLVACRLKGCGMHWSRPGATAITALRAEDLNGHWHQLWAHLTLTG